MAGPTVTLNFAGDSSDLKKSFDQVGSSANDMRRDVGSATRDVSAGVDVTGQKAGDLESGFRGVTDSMSGFSQIAQGDVLGGLTDLAGGAEAFATGLSGAVIPAMKRFIARIAASTVVTNILTVAQGALNAVMALNPITLVVIALAALAAGLVLAWKNSETFRNIVRGAFNVVKRVIDFVVDSTVARFRFWFDTISNIAGGVIGVFQTIGTAIGDAFAGAFDFVRRLWNSTVGGFGFSVPRWIPGIGGRSFRIPSMQTGGIVPGTPGQPQLVLAHGGERISRSSEAGRPSVISVALMLDGKQIAGAVVDPVRRSLLRTTGRNVNLGLA